MVEVSIADRGEMQAVVDWLVEGAPGVGQPQDVLGGLCEQLLACGLPLHRVALFVTTLHPDVMGRRFLWHPGLGVQISEGSYDVLETDTYLRSPVSVVFRTGQTIRLPIASPDCPETYGIVEELRQEGVTDYLLHPLPFTNGEIHAVSWSTTRPGGFDGADIEAFEAIRLPFARLAEVYALRRTATTLLDTYVGRGAGARILQGRIRRGDVESIHAVILLADLRGFTSLSDTLPQDAVIGLLNAWFDCLVPPILARSGEVLKYMGDGLLAIFPTTDDPSAACTAALGAAGEARTALAAINRERTDRGQPSLRHGMALHMGDVAYGNIGSAGRLDFTAIGPAVNRTARLETVARDLNRDLVVSAAFAAQSEQPLAALGSFALKGFREPQEVYAPIVAT
jgi:adenylate cyclase